MSSLLTKYNSGIITIEDSLQCDGKNVLRYILNYNEENVVIISAENYQDKWKSFVKHNICHFSVYSKQPCQILSSATETLKQKSIIVIDSINQLSAQWSWPLAVKFVDDLQKHAFTKCVIIIIHKDCLLYGIKMLKQLRHISQTYIIMESKVTPGKYFINIKTVLPKGKVEESKEIFFYDIQGSQWKSEKVQANSIQKSLSKPITTPHNISSFKIAVENSAKVIKDDLVLPYTNLNSGGNVVYEYDATDDWDDEDPDDDLDI